MSSFYKSMGFSLTILLMTSVGNLQAQKSQGEIAAKWKNGKYKWYSRVKKTAKFKLKGERQNLKFIKKNGEIVEIQIVDPGKTYSYVKDQKGVKYTRYFKSKTGGNWNLFVTNNKIIIFKTYSLTKYNQEKDIDLIGVIGGKPKLKQDDKKLKADLISSWKIQKSQVDAYNKAVRARRAKAHAARRKNMPKRTAANPKAFEYVHWFEDGLARVRISKNSSGFINKSGKLAFPTTYQSVKSFSEGLAAVKYNGKWGYINTTGKMVIEPRNCYQVGDFKDGLARVQYSNKNEIIDKKGNVVLSIKSGFSCSDPSEGMVAYKSGELWGYISKDKKVIRAQYKSANAFSEGLARVRFKNGKVAFINKSGKIVLNLSGYKDAYDFSEGLAAVKNNAGKMGYINKQGKLVIPAKFKYTPRFKDGLAPAKIKGKFGFINKQGKMVIPEKFASTGGFEKGVAWVSVKGKLGAINKSGKWILQPKYGQVSSSNGWIQVDTRGWTTFFDKNGKQVLSLRKR